MKKFIYVLAADSAFTMLRKSLLVNGSFIVSNPLQRETKHIFGGENVNKLLLFHLLLFVFKEY